MNKKYVPDEPLFWMVIALRWGRDDFSIEGIFSKEDDAIAMKSELKACNYILEAIVEQAPMKDILFRLVKAEMVGLELAKKILKDKNP